MSDRWLTYVVEFIVNMSDSTRWIPRSEQELKKSREAMQSLRTEANYSKEKALALLVEAGFVTASGELTKPCQQVA
jgi:hypothetical protein